MTYVQATCETTSRVTTRTCHTSPQFFEPYDDDNRVTPLRVQLRDDQLRSLRALADQRTMSLSTVIRDAIDRLLIEEMNNRDPLLDITGLVEGGPTGVSARRDDYLAEKYDDEHRPREPGTS
jgi:hypothetical protein